MCTKFCVNPCIGSGEIQMFMCDRQTDQQENIRELSMDGQDFSTVSKNYLPN